MFFFPECVARVPVSLGGLGVRLCSPSFAFATATVGNRLRDRRKALHSGECVWSGPESVSSWLFVAAVILVSAEEVSVWVICVAAVILAFAEEGSVKVICVVAVILVSAEEVSVRVICVVAVILVSAEEVSVRVTYVVAIFIGVCRGGVCVSDLCRAVISMSAEELSVWVIGFLAVILAFAEEVSVWVIRAAAVILVSAEEVSVWVICVAAVILVFAEEVSVRVICVPEGCRESMSCQSVLQKCQVRASYNSVK